MNPPSLCPYCGSKPSMSTDGEVHHVVTCCNSICPSEAMRDGVEELTEQQSLISWEELCREQERERDKEEEEIVFEKDNVDTKEHYER